jgi:hypothetical protein
MRLAACKRGGRATEFGTVHAQLDALRQLRGGRPAPARLGTALALLGAPQAGVDARLKLLMVHQGTSVATIALPLLR